MPPPAAKVNIGAKSSKELSVNHVRAQLAASEAKYNASVQEYLDMSEKLESSRSLVAQLQLELQARPSQDCPRLQEACAECSRVQDELDNELQQKQLIKAKYKLKSHGVGLKLMALVMSSRRRLCLLELISVNPRSQYTLNGEG